MSEPVAVTAAIAGWVQALEFDAIDAAAVSAAKLAILDCVGVSIAGSTEPMGRLATEYVRGLGATESAGVLGTGVRTSLEHAAFANGVFAHALDYDDTWAPPGSVAQQTASHPTCTLVPVLFPLGEVAGCSGRDLLTAFVAGIEVHGKIGFPDRTTVRPGFHGSSIFGALGAAAACARLLRLTREQTQMTLSLSGAHAAGLNVNRGTMGKPYQVGNVSAGAVRAAQLVRAGYTAALDGIEGFHGFVNAFVDPTAWDPVQVIGTLGAPLSMIAPGVEMKKYAACFLTHRALDAAVQIATRHDLRGDEVAAITVIAPPRSIVNRPAPATGLEAKFSLQFTVAHAVLERQVGFRAFHDDRLADARIRALMERVEVIEDPSLRSDFPLIERPLAIRLHDGTVLDDPMDTPDAWTSPMSPDDIVAKYRDNVAESMTEAELDRSIEQILTLEQVDDVAPLAQTLTCRHVTTKGSS